MSGQGSRPGKTPVHQSRDQQAEAPERQTEGLATPPSPYADILALQRTAGNQAVDELARQATEDLPPTVNRVLQTSARQPLDPATRSFMEERFNHDFSGVQVHTDGPAVEAARSVQAGAFAIGQDLVFDQGEYRPETQRGTHLLAHELSHVVQQSRGGSTPPSLTPGNSLDAAANEAAAAVVEGSGPVAVAGSSAPGLARQTKAELEELARQDAEYEAGDRGAQAETRSNRRQRQTTRQHARAEKATMQQSEAERAEQAATEVETLLSSAQAGAYHRTSRSNKVRLLDRFENLLKQTNLQQWEQNKLKGDFDEALRTPRQRSRMAGPAQEKYVAGSRALPHMELQPGRDPYAQPDYVTVQATGQGGKVRMHVNLKSTNVHTQTPAAARATARRDVNQAIRNTQHLPGGEFLILDYAHTPSPEVQAVMNEQFFREGSPVAEVRYGSVTYRNPRLAAAQPAGSPLTGSAETGWRAQAPPGSVPAPAPAQAAAPPAESIPSLTGSAETGWRAQAPSSPAPGAAPSPLAPQPTPEPEPLPATSPAPEPTSWPMAGESGENLRLSYPELRGAFRYEQGPRPERSPFADVSHAELEAAVGGLGVIARGEAPPAGSVSGGDYQRVDMVRFEPNPFADASDAELNRAMRGLDALARGEPAPPGSIESGPPQPVTGEASVPQQTKFKSPLSPPAEAGFGSPAAPASGPFHGAMGTSYQDEDGKWRFYAAEIFGVTPEKDTYAVRVGPPGSYVDHIFNTEAEAVAYARMVAQRSEGQIRNTSALPAAWPPGPSGKVDPSTSNPVDAVRVFRVEKSTVFNRSGIGPQPESLPGPGRPAVYEGGGPQVQLAYGTLNAKSQPITHEGAPAQFPVTERVNPAGSAPPQPASPGPALVGPAPVLEGNAETGWRVNSPPETPTAALREAAAVPPPTPEAVTRPTPAAPVSAARPAPTPAAEPIARPTPAAPAAEPVPRSTPVEAPLSRGTLAEPAGPLRGETRRAGGPAPVEGTPGLETELGSGIGGGIQMIEEGMLQIQERQEQEKANAEYKRMEPQIEQLRRQGQYVVVRAVLDVPATVNLLESVYREPTEVRRFHGLVITHGRTAAEALNPPTTLSAATEPFAPTPPKLEGPAPGRTWRDVVLEPGALKPYPPEKPVWGNYRSAETSHVLRLEPDAGGSMQVRAWDAADNEPLVVTDFAPFAELGNAGLAPKREMPSAPKLGFRATLRKSSTGTVVRATFEFLPDGKLRGTYEGVGGPEFGVRRTTNWSLGM